MGRNRSRCNVGPDDVLFVRRPIIWLIPVHSVPLKAYLLEGTREQVLPRTLLLGHE